MSMIDPTLLAAVNTVAETAVNKAIQLDSACDQLLDKLGECAVALTLLPPGLMLFINFQTGRVRISTEPHEVQLRVSGAPLSLAELIKSSDDDLSPAQQLQQAAEQNKTSVEIDRVRITGDLQTAVRIRQFLSLLELDWEAALADKIGDIPAHFIGTRLRDLFKWEKTSRHSILMDIDEYVHEESRDLPSRQECEQQHQHIHDLQQQTESLEGRIQRLHSLLNKEVH